MVRGVADTLTYRSCFNLSVIDDMWKRVHKYLTKISGEVTFAQSRMQKHLGRFPLGGKLEAAAKSAKVPWFTGEASKNRGFIKKS